ncbi:hypothetical protein Kpol_1064p36 [Vanderwaltozyma polyspora DSM 70294]|uniref:AB hydrolase-1 domain-containing protein n=1 Tax=Vanderwaltozyma polyspora (strain ATCC 22028 / DSM 70294 / BCRC 21397 / CBS 2163 / NBRC 10782 / NRRL Y-8283 / UCD 57-17) TaxID=436907 RepID=A7TMG0_VANPO|nr:uncharacterized protein Kpol_1064p36 [Vanderwaltozyma polyspora DSM 70294]EDO16554.1 hypothetical protein Kpol_1064p36 [Vanderwaltozyma polyspora DSM 70294]
MAFSEHLPNYLTVKAVLPNHPIYFQLKDRNQSVGKNPTVSFPNLIEKYVPEFKNGSSSMLHPYLINGHFQTAYASLKKFQDIDQVKYKRLVLNYSDGGEGTVDFVVNEEKGSTEKAIKPYSPKFQKFLPSKSFYSFFSPNDPRLKSDDTKPLVIVLHGLAGGSSESYVRSLVHNITENYGFEACVLNARGCCHSTITTPQLYNCGWTNDIRHCVNTLKSMYPNRKFYMVGFSLGASVLTNYLGEEGENSQISCAIAVSLPWNLTNASHYINSTTIGKRVYSQALCKSLVRLTHRHIEELRKSPTFESVYSTRFESIKFLDEFDNFFTGPMFGYKDGVHYYEDASAYQRLPFIRTPFIAINARDDPITGPVFPEKEFQQNPYTVLIETDIGGHVAWFNGEKGKRWYLEPICRFLSTYHKEISSKGYEPVAPPNTSPSKGQSYVMTTYRKQIASINDKV